MISETDLMTRTAVKMNRIFVCIGTPTEIQTAFRFMVLATRSTTADFRLQ
jgi:hypothetical protein